MELGSTELIALGGVAFWLVVQLLREMKNRSQLDNSKDKVVLQALAKEREGIEQLKRDLTREKENHLAQIETQKVINEARVSALGAEYSAKYQAMAESHIRLKEKLEEQKLELAKEINILQTEVSRLTSEVHMLQTERDTLRKEINEQNAMTNEELKELRLLASLVKRKFKTRDTTELLTILKGEENG